MNTETRREVPHAHGQASMALSPVARIEAHCHRSIESASAFFQANAGAIAEACHRMAERFDGGGSLLVLGRGAQASDAQHVAVEFVHPVLVGKRALPAIAFTSDAGVLTGTRSSTAAFASPLRTVGKPNDIALALCATEVHPSVTAALSAARDGGMLTMLLTGRAADPPPVADIVFRVDESDELIVQEVHETLYHVLWELVHLFLEDDAGLQAYLASADMPSGTEDRLAQARESTLQKCRDICELRAAVLSRHAADMAKAADAIAMRVSRGGKVLAFGCGGSATDAQDAAADCMAPTRFTWRAIPALALTNDVGVVTAVANDIGFDHVFARQVIAFGNRDDIALGISTSGTSRSVLSALREARARGLLTIAFAGYDGGEMAAPGAADFCFVAPSDYVPRIQEAHATIWHALLGVVQSEIV